MTTPPRGAMGLERDHWEQNRAIWATDRDGDLGVAIMCRGVSRTVRALEAFAKDTIYREFNLTVRDALREVRDGAVARYPKGAWGVGRSKKRMLGYVFASRSGTRAGTRVEHWSQLPPGARSSLFEFAGHDQDGRTPGAKGLIESLDRRYGETGRFLWDSWDEHKAEVLTRVREAFIEAERQLQAQLDAAGEEW